MAEHQELAMIVIIPWFSLSLNACWDLSASKFHFKGEAAGVTRCGGASGLVGKAVWAPREHTPSSFIRKGSLGPGDCTFWRDVTS